MDSNWRGAQAVAGLGDAPLPAPARLLLLTSGKRISQVIYALAEVQVADALADGPLPVEELARRTDTDPGALYRLLRCAAAVGVFAEREGREFALTELAEAMRADVPQSQRDMILFNGSEEMWAPYGRIVDSLRTGEPVFPELFGADFFDHLRAHPEVSAVFDRAMTRMSATTTRQFLDAYDFGRFGRVADVGGGRGHFLAELLHRHPSVRGTLVDQPHVAEVAAGVFAARGWRTGPRCGPVTSSASCPAASTRTCSRRCCTTGTTRTRWRSCAGSAPRPAPTPRPACWCWSTC